MLNSMGDGAVQNLIEDRKYRMSLIGKIYEMKNYANQMKFQLNNEKNLLEKERTNIRNYLKSETNKERNSMEKETAAVWEYLENRVRESEENVPEYIGIEPDNTDVIYENQYADGRLAGAPDDGTPYRNVGDGEKGVAAPQSRLMKDIEDECDAELRKIDDYIAGIRKMKSYCESNADKFA
ncbi:unnamed protein product [Phyllotreta striolata]|uniref:Uncharacterized protein n=1 Tax=Phyllotreta striolata TaxID=444603 RepID=A0A9N9TJW1_PHYSR|nr:unnamed protein product [Phyllotreta striolata]